MMRLINKILSNNLFLKNIAVLASGYANFYIGVADYNLGSKETACEYWEKARQLGYAQSSKMIDERCR